ncbi:MAG: iron-containing alcohol dehydrogenase [Oscillospiraceae bacterium]|nr:iron-containing alcohol dehydrogenase [Oscillospiraceae bacterium]
MCEHIPTEFFCEDGCTAAHRDEIASLGGRALIVTGGRSSKMNGSLDDMTDVLGKCGIAYSVFDRVEENPSVETVMAGTKAALELGADMIIGIGGGSPLDAAKAVALMAANPDRDAEFLVSGGNGYAHPLPLVCVPTTCGTGSEVTPVSVLTYHDRRTKGSVPFKIYPDIALCDGKYLMYAPHRLIVNTAVDTLGHLTESYLNSAADEHSRSAAEKGFELWQGNRPLLEGEPLTAGGCTALMTASAYGGAAIAHTGTGIPHGLSYTLTYEEHIPHGLAVGYFLAGYVSLCSDSEIHEIMGMTGFADTHEMDSFIRRTSGGTGIDRQLASLAAKRLAENPKKLSTAPFDADTAAVEKIAYSALSAD